MEGVSGPRSQTSIDKSRVFDVKPLRTLVPVFPNPPQAPPFVCSSPLGPFPSGFTPFYPFSMAGSEDGPRQQGVPSFGTPAAAIPLIFKSKRLATAIMSNLPESEMVESCSVAGALAKSIQTMLREGIETWAPRLSIDKALVDFSSPNIAKEMHVGHLRSTIIGDSMARLLEFSSVEVLRRKARNHVGDWGTQFGMLMEFLFEQYPQWDDDNDIPIKDLQTFYKQSKKRFDEDLLFKQRAQKAVVSLQKIYERLRVNIEEKGESFYNPYIPRVLEILSNEGLIEESEGAQVKHIDGKKIPFIVVERDGGFNYASTDLTALWYRLYEEKAEWIIYVTDVGQREHFEMFFHVSVPEDTNSSPLLNKSNHSNFFFIIIFCYI
ncbi:hypothetical protein RND81_11G113500 [Saponaria officinalis]|uniref:Arginyl-tRNA synthetase n=1 Tax=Saponaria officinalis TaxID=3572 RepID=A0AAW1HLS6_SAPOF